MGLGTSIFRSNAGPVFGPHPTLFPQANASPSGTPDRYFTEEGKSVRFNVIANDTDSDGDRLSVVSVNDPANGTAVRNSDGTVTYTPDEGFDGTDVFTYTLTDGTYQSSATITMTVHAASDPEPDDILLHYHFDWGMEGMRYADDRFGPVGSGERVRGALEDGAIGVRFDDDEGTLAENLSGGWRVEFNLAEAKNLRLDFKYSVWLDGSLENNEQLSVIATLDGAMLGPADGPLATHNAPGGGDFETGWITVGLDIGDVGAGTHFLDLGALLTRRNHETEDASVFFDDVTLYAGDPGGAISADDGPLPTPLTPRLTTEADIVELRATDEEMDASFGDDAVNGMGGNDLLFGSAGNDTLKGAKGNDTLVGGDGDDVFWGGSGDDVLWGGAGVDALVGDEGADTFRFSEASLGSVDRIRDFSVDEVDVIDISNLIDGFIGAADLAGYVDMFENDGNTILRVDRDGGGDAFERVAVLVNTLELPDVGSLYSDQMLILL